MSDAAELKLRAKLVGVVMGILGEEFEAAGEQLVDKIMQRIDAVKAAIPPISPVSSGEAMQQIQAVAAAGMTGIFQATGDVLQLISAVMKAQRHSE